MKCTHNDCLTCPYPDCLYEKAKEKGKAPKRTNDRSEYWANYYEENKEKIKKRMRQRYHDNKQKYSDYFKKRYQQKKKEAAG